MYERYYILVLCLFILGGSLNAKRNNDWKRHSTTDDGSLNKDARSHPKVHDLQSVRPSETINIDDHPPQSDVYMGSGDQPVDDENDPSGDGLDDEDAEGSADSRITDEEGSADGIFKSPCQKLKAELNARKVIGAYTPRCTLDGAFEKTQCSGSTGECWCVDEMGRELDGTKLQAPNKPDCEQDIIVVDPDKTLLQGRPEPNEPEAEPKSGPENIPPTDPSQESAEGEDFNNRINNMPGGNEIEIETMAPPDTNKVEMMESKGNKMMDANVVMTQPGILAGIIGGAVVGLLCAVLLVMFIVYRMRKKDEGSYALDEPRRSPSLHTYSRTTNREFYA